MSEQSFRVTAIFSCLALSGLIHPVAYAACDLDQIETQTDMNLRSYESYQDAEKKLTEVYRALLKRTFKESRPKLIAAQRAWIKWRDADCAFELDGQGGSIRPFVTN